jgi:hypothetical protein
MFSECSQRIICCLVGLVCLTCPPPLNAEDMPASRKVWAEWMGEWRMTGQPRRGSSVGAWTSDAKAAWVGAGAAKAIELNAPKAVFGKKWTVGIDPKTGDARSLTIELPVGDSKTLDRKPSDSEDRFVFVDEGSSSADGWRLTLARKSRDRWTALLESRKSTATVWSRVHEFGLTRQGTTIAQGSGQRECVVTGGLGEIAVTVNSKTVYVCCSGCRVALLSDPDAFLTDAKPATATRQDQKANP